MTDNPVAQRFSESSRRPESGHAALRTGGSRGCPAATIITSNRGVDEWVALFDNPILANSALDRFAHRAHQIVMEGPSRRTASA